MTELDAYSAVRGASETASSTALSLAAPVAGAAWDHRNFIATISRSLGIDPSNQIASGGIALGVVTAVVASLRVIGGSVASAMWRSLTVKAEFDSRDEAYLWLLGFLSENEIARRTTRFTVSTSFLNNQRTVLGNSSSSSSVNGDDASVGAIMLPRILFLPSPGTHIFTFNRRILWLSRQRTKVGGVSGGETQSGAERMTIMALGRDRRVLEDLAIEARRLFVEKDKARTVIYSADQYGNWRRTRSKPIRPLSTIVLDEGVKERVLRDVKEFLESETWYAERGIPYRRGYMFEGYPGTGKSSFVTALAGELKLNIYVISLANKGLTDETLTELMVDTPPRCILLLEDIDAAFVSRTATEQAHMQQQNSRPTNTSPVTNIVTNVTFSGLLNAIDGVAAQEGRILVMTTNHIEKLDPALIRPGRVDVRIHFDRATPAQARQLFSQFFPATREHDAGAIAALAKGFEGSVVRDRHSMAALQGYLMRYKGDPVSAVENFREFVEGQ